MNIACSILIIWSTKQCWISDPVSVRSCFSPSTHSRIETLQHQPQQRNLSYNLGSDRVSQVKSSNCFRLHPTSVISKHSTILVPDSLCGPRKISFTFRFWGNSLILDDVKLAQLSNNSFERKNVIFQGIKTYCDLECSFMCLCCCKLASIRVDQKSDFCCF